jgi:hypothetical protein
MARWSWFSLPALLLAAVALTGRAPARQRTAPEKPNVAGAWIWTARDRQLFERSRERHPELSASILVGTVGCSAQGLGLRRGLSPASTGAAPRALILRFEDETTRCLVQDEAATAQSLDRALEGLLSEVAATGTTFRELQLDYDAPVSKLGHYARLLGYLKQRSLAKTELWITSIPAHVTANDYGDLMRPYVAGHVLQLFDTGLDCSPGRAERLRSALSRQGLAYRLGYGAFERQGAPPARSHACWLELSESLRRAPGAAGFWIFPAGIAYEPTLRALARRP